MTPPSQSVSNTRDGNPRDFGCLCDARDKSLLLAFTLPSQTFPPCRYTDRRGSTPFPSPSSVSILMSNSITIRVSRARARARFCLDLSAYGCARGYLPRVYVTSARCARVNTFTRHPLPSLLPPPPPSPSPVSSKGDCASLLDNGAFRALETSHHLAVDT